METSFPRSRSSAKSMCERRGELREFVEPRFAEGEAAVALIAIASGPLPPFFPIVPVVGVLAMFTRWYRGYGLVVTTRRVLLVRRRKLGRARPRSIDLDVALDRVAVLKAKVGSSYATLVLGVDGRRIRLHPLRGSWDEIGAVQKALSAPGSY